MMQYFATFPVTPESCLMNRALNYGDGVFETMLVTRNTIPLLSLHMLRLTESLKSLGIHSPDQTEISDNILNLVQSSDKYVAKLVVFRKDYNRGYTTKSSDFEYFITVNPYVKGLVNNTLTISKKKLARCEQLASIKHLCRLEQVLAAIDLNNSIYSDAVVCDTDNNIIETTYRNIILIKDEKLFSPSLKYSGIYGVALRWLKSNISTLSSSLKFQPIKINQLSDFEGMLVCNSVQGFSLIKNVDNRIHFSQNLPIADRIKSLWIKFTEH